MPKELLIAPIVEGYGDVDAVPILLRRIALETDPSIQVAINPAIRVKSESFIHDEGYFRKYVELAARKAKAHKAGCVLILLDSEDMCPAKLGPDLLSRARTCRADVNFLVVLAYREYETWFLAAAESLRGMCGLPDTMVPPNEPEMIRGAKEWLSAQMGYPYDAPRHQPSLTNHFSFAQASSVDSFGRCLAKFRTLFSSDET